MQAGKFVNGGKYYRYVGDVVLSRFVTIFTLFDMLSLSVQQLKQKVASFFHELDERFSFV